MRQDISYLIELKKEIKKLHEQSNEIHDKIARLTLKVRESCKHPTYRTVPYEDEYGKVNSWGKFCTICGEEIK